MLSQAHDQLRNEENKKVSYALIDLSQRDWELYGSLAGRKYDYILMHFSLHNFISKEQNLKSFAGRLKQILAYGGEIIVAIHDHVYGSINEEEELRIKIRDFAQKNGIRLKGKSKTISLHDLKSDFFKNGLLVVKERSLPLERNMKERIMMWKVDAILDSMLDVEELKNKNLKDELFKELGEIETEHSASMIVNYISFSEIIRVSSALIVNDKGEFLTVVKNGSYLLPGGELLQFNESEKQTLLRELHEELEINPEGIVIGERLGVFQFKKAYLEDKPLHMIVYRCELKQTVINPNSEISDYEWIDLKKFTTYDNMPKEYFLKILKAAKILLKETKETEE